MNRFAIYETSTGKILRIVRCPEAIAELQAGEGESVLPAADVVGDDTHHVIAGEIVPIE